GLAISDGGVLAVVPGPALTRAAEQLLNLGTPTPNDAGLVVQPLTGPLASAVGSMTGVLVVDVTPGSPAEGVILPGDLIETVDDAPAGTPETLLLRMARSAPGSVLRLGVRRNGERVDVDLAFAGAGSMRALPPWPGFTTEASADGARVRAVDAGSPAAAAGLRAGDVITYFAGRPRPTPRDLGPLVSGVEEGQRALVIVERDGRPHALALERPR
ncbi:MAG: PDZ domain-containing protein, partial [Vicinamibacteria bacterium]